MTSTLRRVHVWVALAIVMSSLCTQGFAQSSSNQGLKTNKDQRDQPGGKQEPVFVPGALPDGLQNADLPGVQRAPGLKILILEGRMKVNRLTEGFFATPVVEVRDGDDRPVTGAQVTFILPPEGGPGASFPGGVKEKLFLTNLQGQALAEGYVPNKLEGRFTVKVRASHLNEKTEISFTQANSYRLQADDDRQKSRAWRKWLWIGVAGAAGGTTAAILLNRKSGDASVISVIPGPPVFGGR